MRIPALPVNPHLLRDTLIGAAVLITVFMVWLRWRDGWPLKELAWRIVLAPVAVLFGVLGLTIAGVAALTGRLREFLPHERRSH